ncbi:hypothetical protein ACFJIW_20440 [Tahibacter sp. UC22_41]|uniref:hypothetical protein n=1 Tax=Tahibacter sp. UC22_41 TaxID=3350178 RepID=UPI0036DDE5F4
MTSKQQELLAQADTLEALRDAIAKLDIAVPLRTEGRKTAHVERYAIAHLVASAAFSDVRFPLKLFHQDRPDFLIEEHGGRRIAIEQVEAIPENEAKRAALRELEEDEGVHFIQHAEPGEEKRSTEQLRREIRNDEAGDGWVGDSAEREWAAAMIHFASVKLRLIGKDGYDRGDETWLLIYDNWPAPVIKPELAARYFTQHPALAEIFKGFGRILVLDDHGIWEFSANGARYHPHSAE